MGIYIGGGLSSVAYGFGMACVDEAESFHERRLRRLTLTAVYQVLVSEPLSSHLCDGCRDHAVGIHTTGCQAPLETWSDSIRKAELWSQAYCYYGFNWGPVHWTDLEILRPRIVEALLRYNWSSAAVAVSVIYVWCLNGVAFFNGRGNL